MKGNETDAAGRKGALNRIFLKCISLMIKGKTAYDGGKAGFRLKIEDFSTAGFVLRPKPQVRGSMYDQRTGERRMAGERDRV